MDDRVDRGEEEERGLGERGLESFAGLPVQRNKNSIHKYMRYHTEIHIVSFGYLSLLVSFLLTRHPKEKSVNLHLHLNTFSFSEGQIKR